MLSAAKALLKARRPAHEIAGLAAAAVGVAEHRIVAALLPPSSPPSPPPSPSAVRTRERTRMRFDELAAEHAVVGEASMHVPAAPNAELERVRCALRHLDTALRVGARSSSPHTSGLPRPIDAQGGRDGEGIFSGERGVAAADEQMGKRMLSPLSLAALASPLRGSRRVRCAVMCAATRCGVATCMHVGRTALQHATWTDATADGSSPQLSSNRARMSAAVAHRPARTLSQAPGPAAAGGAERCTHDAHARSVAVDTRRRRRRAARRADREAFGARVLRLPTRLRRTRALPPPHPPVRLALAVRRLLFSCGCTRWRTCDRPRDLGAARNAGRAFARALDALGTALSVRATRRRCGSAVVGSGGR